MRSCGSGTHGSRPAGANYRSRSQSPPFVASPEVRRDLCMASRAIRSMLHAIDRVASRCEDEAHLLRSFQIDVGRRPDDRDAV
jgi:hypothetical protein